MQILRQQIMRTQHVLFLPCQPDTESFTRFHIKGDLVKSFNW